jgi:hypothetical protein
MREPRRLPNAVVAVCVSNDHDTFFLAQRSPRAEAEALGVHAGFGALPQMYAVSADVVGAHLTDAYDAPVVAMDVRQGFFEDAALHADVMRARHCLWLDVASLAAMVIRQAGDGAGSVAERVRAAMDTREISDDLRVQMTLFRAQHCDGLGVLPRAVVCVHLSLPLRADELARAGFEPLAQLRVTRTCGVTFDRAAPRKRPVAARAPERAPPEAQAKRATLHAPFSAERAIAMLEAEGDRDADTLALCLLMAADTFAEVAHETTSRGGKCVHMFTGVPRELMDLILKFRARDVAVCEHDSACLGRVSLLCGRRSVVGAAFWAGGDSLTVVVGDVLALTDITARESLVRARALARRVIAAHGMPWDGGAPTVTMHLDDPPRAVPDDELFRVAGGSRELADQFGAASYVRHLCHLQFVTRVDEVLPGAAAAVECAVDACCLCGARVDACMAFGSHFAVLGRTDRVATCATVKTVSMKMDPAAYGFADAAAICEFLCGGPMAQGQYYQRCVTLCKGCKGASAAWRSPSDARSTLVRMRACCAMYGNTKTWYGHFRSAAATHLMPLSTELMVDVILTHADRVIRHSAGRFQRGDVVALRLDARAAPRLLTAVPPLSSQPLELLPIRRASDDELRDRLAPVVGEGGAARVAGAIAAGFDVHVRDETLRVAHASVFDLEKLPPPPPAPYVDCVVMQTPEQLQFLARGLRDAPTAEYARRILVISF